MGPIYFVVIPVVPPVVVTPPVPASGIIAI
jgi:hypothetical protein